MAQVVHAAVASFCPAPEPVEDYAIVLQARDEAHLSDLELRLQDAGVGHAAFREPDLGNSLTAIGITPVGDRRVVRRFLHGYPLLGENS